MSPLRSNESTVEPNDEAPPGSPLTSCCGMGVIPAVLCQVIPYHGRRSGISLLRTLVHVQSTCCDRLSKSTRRDLQDLKLPQGTALLPGAQSGSLRHEQNRRSSSVKPLQLPHLYNMMCA